MPKTRRHKRPWRGWARSDRSQQDTRNVDSSVKTPHPTLSPEGRGDTKAAFYGGINFVSAPTGRRPTALSLSTSIQASSCPNGAMSQSPGLRRRRYPGNRYTKSDNPNGVEAAHIRNPFGVVKFLRSLPRVGASHQPWAGGLSPFGAEAIQKMWVKTSPSGERVG